jgi:hypothetical protein
MNHKKELITEKHKDKVLKDLSDHANSNHNQVELQDILRDLQITLDDPRLEDSIDGTRIRAIYSALLSRKKGTGEQREQILRFQYIKEIPVDYSSVPISFADRASAVANKAKSDTTIQNNEVGEDVITESYEKLDEASPSLQEMLGLLKRIYFTPEDFSNRLAVDLAHKLRNMFTKDEILAFPSVSPDNRSGLVPI